VSEMIEDLAEHQRDQQENETNCRNRQEDRERGKIQRKRHPTVTLSLAAKDITAVGLVIASGAG